jgi:hypothetical protein
MFANLKIKAPHDRKRICTYEKWEINYWTQTFKCTEPELKLAIREIGNSVDEIKLYFKI